MASEPKKEVAKIALKDRIKNNRLVSITILLGIIGILFPLLGWILEVTTPLQTQDLEKLRDDLLNIQKNANDIQKMMDEIIRKAETSVPVRSWKLNEHERNILKKMSEGQRTYISAVFNFILFSLQGAFFILIGIIVERKILASRLNIKKRDLPTVPPKDVIKDSTKDNIFSRTAEIKNVETSPEKNEAVTDNLPETPIKQDIVSIERENSTKDNSSNE